MYNSNNRNNRSHANNFQGQRNSFGRPRNRRVEKKLDPNLFIKHIKESNVIEHNQAEEEITARFDDYAVVDKIKRNIAEHGYEIPTAIQEKAIPQILAGRDVIGIANTGTGKTAAFLITLINKSFLDRNQRVLIVVPTRELATQIVDEFKIFAKGTGIEAVAAIGGTNMKRQTYALRHRPHFVIGTPGRLTDLIQRHELNLNIFQNVVLDEVDRMVDIGFIKDIKYIISLLPKV
ncbi:MAG TPA: DEAD/DEAH box helicase, partial [Patescibacteria group bacterium]|nr:DEAD/DEAH box helicase [Patescibacteria group bacterium]